MVRELLNVVWNTPTDRIDPRRALGGQELPTELRPVDEEAHHVVLGDHVERHRLPHPKQGRIGADGQPLHRTALATGKHEADIGDIVDHGLEDAGESLVDVDHPLELIDR